MSNSFNKHYFASNFVYMFVSVCGFVLVTGFQKPEECIESPGVGIEGGCEPSNTDTGSKLGSSSRASHAFT